MEVQQCFKKAAQGNKGTVMKKINLIVKEKAYSEATYSKEEIKNRLNIQSNSRRRNLLPLISAASMFIFVLYHVAKNLYYSVFCEIANNSAPLYGSVEISKWELFFESHVFSAFSFVFLGLSITTFGLWIFLKKFRK